MEECCDDCAGLESLHTDDKFKSFFDFVKTNANGKGDPPERSILMLLIVQWVIFKEDSCNPTFF